MTIGGRSGRFGGGPGRWPGPHGGRLARLSGPRGGRLAHMLALVPLYISLAGHPGCPAVDADGDGYPVHQGDCDDHNSAVHPGAPEVCDGIDNNCNGQIDEGAPASTWYPDGDRDGYGAAEGTVTACAPPPGFVPVDGDCDDADPETYPGALERCDGKDNDCDGKPEAADATRFYRDADRDGFGVETDVVCDAATGYVPDRGDCDDADPGVHPGATDPAGDGIDQDCGGTDGPEPHVGLSAQSQPTIADALEIAADGTTVWVGPGTWPGNGLSFFGKALQLRATRSAATTVIDGGGNGPVFDLSSGEGPDALIDSFTLTGGGAPATTSARAPAGPAQADRSAGPRAAIHEAATVSPSRAKTPGEGVAIDPADAAPDYGGGMLIQGSSPTISDCVITGNTANIHGGGVYLFDSSALFLRCTFSANVSAGGGGAAMESSSPTFSSCTFSDNQVVGNGVSGGGLYVVSSSPTLTHCTLTGNRAEFGGGAQFRGSSPTISDTIVSGNFALNDGGGINIGEESHGEIRSTDFLDNAAATGGGVSLHGSSDTVLADCTFSRNSAVFGGGGLNLSSEVLTLSDLEFADNTADEGGAVYVSEFTGGFIDSTFTGNHARAGGAIASGYVELDLLGCDFIGNQADEDGGALNTNGPQQTLEDVVFEGNTAYRAGAVWEGAERPTHVRTSFIDNRATHIGGAIYEAGNAASFLSCTFSGNAAGDGGGAIFDDEGDATLIRNCYLVGNSAANGGALSSGGGSTLEIDNAILTGNTGEEGGAIQLNSTDARLSNCLITGNSANDGGGIFVNGADLTLTRCVLSRNQADPGVGGGLYVLNVDPNTFEVDNAIFAYNGPDNLFVDPGSPGPFSLRYSILYNPSGQGNHNLPALGPTVRVIEPGFLAYDAGGLPTDFHLALASPAVDTGDPALIDVDGSRSDLGAFGGPGGAGFDIDLDGRPNWFWPGTIDDAPSGFDPAAYDANDLDPAVH